MYHSNRKSHDKAALYPSRYLATGHTPDVDRVAHCIFQMLLLKYETYFYVFISNIYVLTTMLDTLRERKCGEYYK